MARKRRRRKRPALETITNIDITGGLPGEKPQTIETPLPEPPPGTYDPVLDAQRRGATRGLGYLMEDLSRGQERDTSDYLLAQDTVGLSRKRGEEDYAAQVGALDLNYSRLANRQAQQARQAGVLSASAQQQSASKRTFNRALDQKPLDTAKTRFGEDLDRQLGELATGYRRRGEDRFQVELPRAQREDVQFGLDIDEAKRYQSGVTMPENPYTQAAADLKKRRRRKVKYGASRFLGAGLGR